MKKYIILFCIVISFNSFPVDESGFRDSVSVACSLAERTVALEKDDGKVFLVFSDFNREEDDDDCLHRFCLLELGVQHVKFWQKQVNDEKRLDDLLNRIPDSTYIKMICFLDLLGDIAEENGTNDQKILRMIRSLAEE